MRLKRKPLIPTKSVLFRLPTEHCPGDRSFLNDARRQTEVNRKTQRIRVLAGSRFRILTYSLALFHEIDFVVNEGYRKIPHGGVETGGLLFGSLDASGYGIEAFRDDTLRTCVGSFVCFFRKATWCR